MNWGCKNSYTDAVHSSEEFGFPIHSEITILGKESEFQVVGEKDIAKLLEWGTSRVGQANT
jgi:hypothetical protein